MSNFAEINIIFEEADKIVALKELYLERGNVSEEEALEWVIEKYRTAQTEMTEGDN